MRPRVFECPRAHPGAKIPSSCRLLFSPLVGQPMDGSARAVRARVANKPARFLDDAADDEPPPKRAKEGGNSEVRSPRDSGRDPTSTLRQISSRLSRLRVWGKILNRGARPDVRGFGSPPPRRLHGATRSLAIYLARE